MQSLMSNELYWNKYDMNKIKRNLNVTKTQQNKQK